MNRSTKQHYTQSQRETAYGAIVLADDNCNQAARDLAAAGIKIPAGTLREWRRQYPDEIEAVRIAKGPELEEMRARMAEAVATSAGAVTLDLLERMRETQHELSAKDIPGAARNAATVYGIATEKGLLHRQKPTTITQHDYTGNMKALERMGLVVDSTAEEIPETVDVKEIASA